MTAKTRISLLLVIVTVIVSTLQSCGSDSYPGLYYEQEVNIDNDENNNATEVKVFLEEQKFFEVNPVADGRTRGTGVFEDEKDEYGNELRTAEDEQKFTFHVFAFHNGADETALLTHSFFNAAGGARDTEHRYCLVDGYDRLGMPAKLNVSRNKELVFQYDRSYADTPDILCYSNKSEYVDRGYNFFVYHIDGSEVSTDRRDDRIVHHIEIDGSQDIMRGTSPILNDKYLDDYFADIKNSLDDTEYSRILNTRGFSAYSARRGIYPIVPLEHELARVKFFLYPGSSDCKHITITRISVELPYKGEFTVAGRETGDMALAWLDDTPGDRREFWVLRGKDNADAAEDTGSDEDNAEKSEDEPDTPGTATDTDRPEYLGIKLPWEDAYGTMPWKDRMRREAGKSLLIPPVKNCKLRIYFTCTMPGFDLDKELYYSYDLPTTDQKMDFKGNNLYNINVAIYGPQKIVVNSNIDMWQFGGDISVGGE